MKLKTEKCCFYSKSLTISLLAGSDPRLNNGLQALGVALTSSGWSYRARRRLRGYTQLWWYHITHLVELAAAGRPRRQHVSTLALAVLLLHLRLLVRFNDVHKRWPTAVPANDGRRYIIFAALFTLHFSLENGDDIQSVFAFFWDLSNALKVFAESNGTKPMWTRHWAFSTRVRQTRLPACAPPWWSSWSTSTDSWREITRPAKNCWKNAQIPIFGHGWGRQEKIMDRVSQIYT